MHIRNAQFQLQLPHSAGHALKLLCQLLFQIGCQFPKIADTKPRPTAPKSTRKIHICKQQTFFIENCLVVARNAEIMRDIVAELLAEGHCAHSVTQLFQIEPVIP